MLKAGVANSKQDDIEPVLGVPRWKPSQVTKDAKALDTTMRVKTPENISFEYQLAGPFRRIFAYFFDIAISLGAYLACVSLIWVLFVVAFIPLAAYLGILPLVEGIGGILSGLISAGWFVVLWFYGAYMEARFNGQTLGKRITKMRVITTDGHAIDGVQATLRNFFRLLDVMPMVPIAAIIVMEPTDSPMDQFFAAPLLPTCLFGLIVMTINRKYQRVGDLVANTVVVNEEQKRMPNLATFLDDRVPLLAELIPTSFIVPATMARSIAEYVDQRKYLPFQRASEIASHLANPLFEQFSIPQDTDHDLFICALYYKTFISAPNELDEMAPLPGQQLAAEPVTNPSTNPISNQPTKIGDFVMDPNDFRIDP